MSRTAYFGSAFALGLFGSFWVMWSRFIFWGRAIQTDSRPDTFWSGSFIAVLIVWGAVFLGIVWATGLCLKRALRSPRRDAPPPTSASSISSEPPQALPTPDERLANLVKKT